MSEETKRHQTEILDAETEVLNPEAPLNRAELEPVARLLGYTANRLMHAAQGSEAEQIADHLTPGYQIRQEIGYGVREFEPDMSDLVASAKRLEEDTHNRSLGQEAIDDRYMEDLLNFGVKVSAIVGAGQDIAERIDEKIKHDVKIIDPESGKVVAEGWNIVLTDGATRKIGVLLTSDGKIGLYDMPKGFGGKDDRNKDGTLNVPLNRSIYAKQGDKDEQGILYLDNIFDYNRYIPVNKKGKPAVAEREIPGSEPYVEQIDGQDAMMVSQDAQRLWAIRDIRTNMPAILRNLRATDGAGNKIGFEAIELELTRFVGRHDIDNLPETSDALTPEELDTIKDLVEFDEQGRARRGIKESSTQKGDNSYVSDHELGLIHEHQDLIRKNLPKKESGAKKKPNSFVTSARALGAELADQSRESGQVLMEDLGRIRDRATVNAASVELAVRGAIARFMQNRERDEQRANQEEDEE